MDGSGFGTLVRGLAAIPSRRSVLAALGAGALAALAGGDRPDDAVARGRKGRKTDCEPCQTRKKGRCKGHTPDDTPCNGDGRCLDGRCNPRPYCLGPEAACLVDGDCCSDYCHWETKRCLAPLFGEPCLADGDCFSGRCIGYRCTYSACPPDADFCTDATETCGYEGSCLRPLAGGDSRCGVHPGGNCNCTSNAECVEQLGRGAFCAQTIGPHCICNDPDAPTFCVVPR